MVNITNISLICHQIGQQHQQQFNPSSDWSTTPTSVQCVISSVKFKLCLTWRSVHSKKKIVLGDFINKEAGKSSLQCSAALFRRMSRHFFASQSQYSTRFNSRFADRKQKRKLVGAKMLWFRFAESQSCKMQLYFMKIDFIENEEKNKEIKFPSRLVKFPRVSSPE